MQKLKSTVKVIRLSRETLLQLSSDRLAGVAGGRTVPTCGGSCNLFIVSNCGSGC
jgi:hypothetical protein